MRRHDLLRTVFEFHGDPVQCATSFRPIRLRKMEFGSLPESERAEAARMEAVREARQPFDLARGPAWRAKLLCCSEREHILVVILHHIICDGWSIGVLVRELVAGYEAFLRGEILPLPGPAIRYADYAAGQRQRLAGPDFRQQVEVWRKRLEGFTGRCADAAGQAASCGTDLSRCPAIRAVSAASLPNPFARLLIRKVQHCLWCCWEPSRFCFHVTAARAT